MPVSAPRLADVGVRDPHPLVLSGRGEHLLQQLAVARLHDGTLAQGHPRRRDPLGERVAHLLELLESGDPRRGKASRHVGIERQARKSLGREPAKLVLEPADLTAQLNPCEALVAPHPKRAERLSFEQIRHRPNRV
jgi:hypothetical protein